MVLVNTLQVATEHLQALGFDNSTGNNFSRRSLAVLVLQQFNSRYGMVLDGYFDCGRNRERLETAPVCAVRDFRNIYTGYG